MDILLTIIRNHKSSVRIASVSAEIRKDRLLKSPAGRYLLIISVTSLIHKCFLIYHISIFHSFIRLFIHSFIYSFINGCTALCWAVAFPYTFVIFFIQRVALLGRRISPSRSYYLHTGQHRRGRNAHTNIHAPSGHIYYLSSSSVTLTGPWPLLQFRNHFFTQMVGLLGRVISSSHGRYLHTRQHKHGINANTDTHTLSVI
jgi:hypothetical protein